MKPGSNLFEEDMSLKVEFPFTVTKNIVLKITFTKLKYQSAIFQIFIAL